MDSLEESFSKFFPGSKTPLAIDSMRQEQEAERNQWDKDPKIFTVRGKEMEFFSIGALGTALGNRSPNTLRAWEREGILPKSVFRKPSTDPRGARRMYSRAMVEGLIQIAKEEGVLWPHEGLRLGQTQFTAKAMELFQRLNRVQ